MKYLKCLIKDYYYLPQGMEKEVKEEEARTTTTTTPTGNNKLMAEDTPIGGIGTVSRWAVKTELVRRVMEEEQIKEVKEVNNRNMWKPKTTLISQASNLEYIRVWCDGWTVGTSHVTMRGTTTAGAGTRATACATTRRTEKLSIRRKSTVTMPDRRCAGTFRRSVTW